MQPAQPKPKKKRITPVSNATPNATAASTAASTHAPTMPLPATTIPRTLKQQREEIDCDVEALLGAAGEWRGLSHAQLVHTDLEDADALVVAAQKLKRRLAAYQAQAAKADDEEQRLEEARRTSFKPLQVDKASALYRKYKSRLPDGNTVLYRCPFSVAATGECLCGSTVCKPGKKATIERHIERWHILGHTKKKAREGYGEAVAGGWVV